MATNHLDNWQPEVAGKGKVATVVTGNRHDGAGSITHEHVIGNPYGNFFIVQRIDRVSAGKHPAYLFYFCHALTVAAVLCPLYIFLNRSCLFGSCNLFYQCMLRGQNHISGPKNGIRAGCENFYFKLFAIVGSKRET